jgi:hypothetical protein
MKNLLQVPNPWGTEGLDLYAESWNIAGMCDDRDAQRAKVFKSLLESVRKHNEWLLANYGKNVEA